MRFKCSSLGFVVALVPLLSACEGVVERPAPPPNEGVESFAGGCYVIDATDPGSDDTRWLAATPSGKAFAFTAREAESGARFYLKASDLGTYLFYDQDGQYLVAEDGPLERRAELESDVLRIDDTYVSGAEWVLTVSPRDAHRFQLRHRRSGKFLEATGFLTDDPATAAVVALYPETGCTEHPELTVDAEGEVAPRRFADGSVYGIVDTHSHMLTNFAFGGGGIFHGAPFHRLGVAHALPDCSLFHGEEGRMDLLGGQLRRRRVPSGPALRLLERVQPPHRRLARLHGLAQRAVQLDAPDAVLPVARARLQGRPAAGRAARDEQLGHV